MYRMWQNNGLGTHRTLAPETPACVSFCEMLFAEQSRDVIGSDITRFLAESEDEGQGGEERIGKTELRMLMKEFKIKTLKRKPL